MNRTRLLSLASTLNDHERRNDYGGTHGQAHNALVGEILSWDWCPTALRHVARYRRPDGRHIKSPVLAVVAWQEEARKADPDISLTPEFNETCTAPASYWLSTWALLPEAVRAIGEATSGRRSSFLTPQGMMMVSPAR